jgi:hypothetical protein
MDYIYAPRGTRSIGRPKLCWKDQLIEERNESKGPNLDAVDDDDDNSNIIAFQSSSMQHF